MQGDTGWDESPDLDTVYFGGGTPSRLEPSAIASLIAGFRADRRLSPTAEVTLEANPDDVTPEAASAWRAAGIGRVSLGVQSFSPDVLAWMHRTHTAGQASAAVQDPSRGRGWRISRSTSSTDSPPNWAGTGRPTSMQAFALEPDHLSCYGLTVETHTPLGHWTARGQATAVDEGQYAEEFLQLSGALGERGWEHYEVSNAARPGHRARHNSGYWTGAPYLGLGPSAHSSTRGERRWNIREYAAWDVALREGHPTIAGSERLTESQQQAGGAVPRASHLGRGAGRVGVPRGAAALGNRPLGRRRGGAPSALPGGLAPARCVGGRGRLIRFTP